MIHKEAWYREIIALVFGDPDPNDPDSFYRYTDDPETFFYSVGGEVKALVSGYWTTIWHGSIAEGELTEATLDALDDIPGKRWHKVQNNPPTWHMNLSGERPFGWGEWALFGFSSKEWESVVGKFIDQYSPESSVVAEFQLQVREHGAKVPVVQQKAPENQEARASDLLEQMFRVAPPPSFASYFTRAYLEFTAFRKTLRTSMMDVGVRRRLLERSKDLRDLMEEFNQAARQSRDPGQLPSVIVPTGLYQYILTGEHPDRSDELRPREEEGEVPGVTHGPHGP